MTTTTNKSATTYEDIDGFFYWVRINEPDYGYNPQKIPKDQLDPQTFRYKAAICVSKEEFNNFFAKYPGRKKPAPLENEDFMKAMKTDTVPFPNQPMQYVITFKQKVYKKDGGLMPESLRPVAKQIENGVQTDITNVAVGNGSAGTLRYSVWLRPDIPPTISLYAICVRNLIPYEAPVRVDPTSFA